MLFNLVCLSRPFRCHTSFEQMRKVALQDFSRDFIQQLGPGGWDAEELGRPDKLVQKGAAYSAERSTV
jgi:hypothetical protein